ncbi:MAG: hypothetical protein GY807_13755 [Gammaproteobacteria bacterium]|nr:hypothetical protein [Gammaproteobacteria bacterium]
MTNENGPPLGKQRQTGHFEFNGANYEYARQSTVSKSQVQPIRSRAGRRPRYSQAHQRDVVLRIGDDRLVLDNLALKFAHERYSCRQDGCEKWLRIASAVHRDDLLHRMRDDGLLSAFQVAELARSLPSYIGGRTR